MHAAVIAAEFRGQRYQVKLHAVVAFGSVAVGS